jgi:hypothetical protein
MKKLLLVAGATAVVVGGGVATANHYDQYQNKKQVAQASEVTRAKLAQYQADLGVRNQLAKANDALQAECAKGEVAYAKLSPLVQKVVPEAGMCSDNDRSIAGVRMAPKIFEDIVGIPDILNEVLADNIVEQNKNKAKLDDGFYQERNRLHSDSGSFENYRGSLVGRAYIRLLQKSI